MASKTVARPLTETEIDIFSKGSIDPNITLAHIFKREGVEEVLQFDRGFTEKGKWQKNFCMAAQTFMVVVGGIGTGKTLAAGISGFYHGVQTPGFKFLNIARESWQSQLMYDLIISNAEGTLAEEFIVSAPKRPYPMIVIEYLLGNRKVRSTMEFMSIGEKGDATNVFSWRGDWINIEEAGRIDNLSVIVANLSTRLTGNTPEGRPYMGRLSLLSNPWENPELWQMYDLAASDKDDGLAIEVLTEDNKNVTEKQLQNALKLIPERERERFITGKRPEGRGTYFPKSIVEPCEDVVLDSVLTEAIENETPGYSALSLPRVGFYNFYYPPEPGRLYLTIGDPGTGEAPARNAPVWMTLDVTDAPKLSTVRALWWGAGYGSITPFLGEMLNQIQMYSPLIAGIDSTSTQKNMAEVVNMEYITGKGYSIDNLQGFSFSSGRKFTYLVCLKVAIENCQIKWPSVYGRAISNQLQNYDPIQDKETSKLPQDLVSALAMAAYAIRSRFGFYLPDEGDAKKPTSDAIEFHRRRSREFNSLHRTSRRFFQRRTR